MEYRFDTQVKIPYFFLIHHFLTTGTDIVESIKPRVGTMAFKKGFGR
jgi:hypothetical protein